MKIGFLGPVGSYTEAAAHLSLPGTHLPLRTVEDVFAAVQSGAVERGVVPFENVIQGYVTETLDALYAYADTVKIIDSQVQAIEHALGALPGHGEITEILSKDQALQQCSNHLQSTYPQASQIETASTSSAMQRIAEAGLTHAAAIGHAKSLQSYGLTVLQHNIGNIKYNKTRFVTLAPVHVAPLAPTGRDCTALVIYPHHDRVGLLQAILTIVSTDHGLSCSSIQSRPDTRGAFRFYLELEGHLHNAAVAACLAALRAEVGGATIEVKVFGSYPRRAFNAPLLNRLTVVGGTGRMGRWFETFFTRAGCQVQCTNEHTPAAELAQHVQNSAAVLVNVPIRQTEAVLRHIAPLLRPGQLLVDNTSIKTQPVHIMTACAAAGVEVLGMHTVFGPNIGDRLLNQNVVFVRTRSCGALALEFESLFHKYGARLQHTTAEHHDLQMALHQNLEHLSKMALAEVIGQLFTAPNDLMHYASPNSRATLASMGRILSADPALFADIQTHNPQAVAVLESYMQHAQALLAQVKQGDSAALQRSMESARQALGEAFVQSMLERSKSVEV